MCRLWPYAAANGGVRVASAPRLLTYTRIHAQAPYLLQFSAAAPLTIADGVVVAPGAGGVVGLIEGIDEGGLSLGHGDLDGGFRAGLLRNVDAAATPTAGGSSSRDLNE